MPIIAATLAMQAPDAPLPLVMSPGSSDYGRTGHWLIIKNSASCQAVGAYAVRPDGGQRLVSLSWIVDNPSRRLVLSMADTAWPRLLAASRGDYRLEYIGASARSNPPPVVPAIVDTRIRDRGGTLTVSFDDAAAPAARANLSRSIGFDVYRGRRRLITNDLDGIVGVLQMLERCAATLPQETPPHP